jgi:hypothetical protein
MTGSAADWALATLQFRIAMASTAPAANGETNDRMTGLGIWLCGAGSAA